jgi:hypothetical protein
MGREALLDELKTMQTLLNTLEDELGSISREEDRLLDIMGEQEYRSEPLLEQTKKLRESISKILDNGTK